MFVYVRFVHVQPEESFSDDFLFPMTSRLSYASSPESDGEFCGDDTPRRSAAVRNPASRQDSNNRLVRSNSDPSLARQDGTIKSEPGDVMTDYSAPPPYSIQPDQVPACMDGAGLVRVFLNYISRNCRFALALKPLPLSLYP